MKKLLCILMTALPVMAYSSDFREIYDIIRSKDTNAPEHADKQQIEAFRNKAAGFLNSDETVLYEDNPKGQGIYFKQNNVQGRRIFLQIPHAYKDLYTRNIGVRLYITGKYFAASFNTAARYIDKNGFREIFDLAHSHSTYWQVFTEEFVRRYPGSAVIQLHGFAEDKRETRSARTADFIVSSGTKNPHKEAYSLHKCLNNKGYIALLYPYETNELGGTTNSTLNMLTDTGYKNFIHLEMGRDFRDKARRGGKALDNLHFCLTESVKVQK